MRSYEFAGDFRKNRIFLRADRVVRPYEMREDSEPVVRTKFPCTSGKLVGGG